MKFCWLIAFIFVFVGNTNIIYADQSKENATISPSEFKLKEISQNPVWRALLGYNQNQGSAITSSNFFLSPKGKSDALEELISTLTAFRQPPTPRIDDHPLCRFRGRYVWLSRQLPFPEMGIAHVDCPEFNDFSANGHAESVSIILVSGFLGNPASYYGHLLLKINKDNQIVPSALEDFAINFGANIPPGENMPTYIAKGILGGYDSSFTKQQYYFHTQTYGESEQRDIWEYQLNLTPEQNELLIAHLWELMEQKYTYYFTNRNCAYRIGELLQIVVEPKLVSSIRPWETPQAIIQRLNEFNPGTKHLITKIRFSPSRQNRFYQRYLALNPDEQNIVNKASINTEHLDDIFFPYTPLGSKYKILDTLMDYYQFIGIDSAYRPGAITSYRYALKKRYQLPPGETDIFFKSDNHPHSGHKPSYINIGLIHNEELGQSVQFWLRPAYYDSLDAGLGHIKNSSLSMGEIFLMINDHKCWIKSVNLFKIENFNRNSTGLRGDRFPSWYIDTGWQQKTLTENESVSAKANALIGYTHSTFGDLIMLGGYAGVGYLGFLLEEEALYASLSFALNINVSENFNLRLDAQHREFAFANHEEQAYQIQIRNVLDEQHDIRFHFSCQHGCEGGASLGYYW